MSLSIDGREITSLHFTGILGCGMSAIAQYLRWQKLDISGSDRLYEGDCTMSPAAQLIAIGCSLHSQDGSGVGANTQGVVVSTAIETSNPDCAEARKRGIPIFHRSDILAAIVASKKTIAIAGTSGKSTVAAMTFHLLQHAGLSPSLIGGANLHSLIDDGCIGNAFCGDSDLLVIEADESDGSLVKYHPAYSVFLNLSKDHKPEDETLALFAQLASQSETIIINGDEPRFASFNAQYSFGTSPNAIFRGMVSGDGSSAHVAICGRDVSVPFPGEYMAWNMLAALSICTQLGVDIAALEQAAPHYRGLQRRFDRIPTRAGGVVIDDYAHNPEKIRAALLAAQSISPGVFALFQPHGFTPARFMFEEYISVFSALLRDTDTLYITPIYYAGGTANKDISSDDIAGRIRSQGKNAFAPATRESAIAEIAKLAKDGVCVISMGARDPSLPAFAQSIAEAIDSAGRLAASASLERLF